MVCDAYGNESFGASRLVDSQHTDKHKMPKGMKYAMDYLIRRMITPPRAMLCSIWSTQPLQGALGQAQDL